jgi:hypothetical protein
MPMTGTSGGSGTDTHRRAYALRRHRMRLPMHETGAARWSPAVRPRTYLRVSRRVVGHDGGVDAVDRDVPSLTLDLPAERESVPEAISRAREFAAGNGAEPETGAAISLAVGDAVDNAVRHAIPGDGDVRVMLDVEDGELEFVVSDGVRGVEVWMRFRLDR